MNSMSWSELSAQLAEMEVTQNRAATAAYMDGAPDFGRVTMHDFTGVPEDTSQLSTMQLVGRVLVSSEGERAVVAGAAAAARGTVEAVKTTGRGLAALGSLAMGMAKRGFARAVATLDNAREAIATRRYQPRHTPREFGSLAVNSLVRRTVRGSVPVGTAALQQKTLALPVLGTGY
jgi:hypothetical protein